MGGGLTILPDIADRYSVPLPKYPTATESMEGLMKLKGQMAENALRAAQTEHVQAQANQVRQAQQMQQRNLDDQNTISNYFQQAQTDPEVAARFGKGDFSDIAGKLKNPANLDLITTHHANALKTLVSLDEAKRTEAKQKEDALFGVLDSAAAVPEDQRVDAFNSGIDHATKMGLIDPNVVPRATALKDLDAIAAGNNMRSRLLDSAQKRAKAEADQNKVEADTANLQAELPAKQAEAAMKQKQAAAMAAMTPETVEQTVDAVIPPTGDSAALNARTKAQAKQALQMGLPLAAVQAVVKDASDQIGRTETAVATAKATAPIKVAINTQEQQARTAAATPDQEALDFMAEKVLAGENPPGRSAVQTAAVYKRAAELAAARGMTTTQAVMEGHAAKSNTQALNSVTKQYETLKPFADMAEKNADILERESKKVDSLGASFFNTPLRDIEGKFGSEKVASFKAALMPVQADFARILNSPTGSGQLTDNARHEMEAAIGVGATPGQIKAAVDIFRQDAQNRKASYEASIHDLKSRSVSGGKSTTDPNAPAGLPAPPPPPPNANFQKMYQGHMYARQKETDPWVLVK